MPIVYVNNTVARLHHFYGKGVKACTLMPGMNEVDADDIAEALKAASFKALVEDGTFVVTEPEKPFAQMPEKDALALVADTVDVELLNKWAIGEKRPAVVKAIAKQIDSVKPTPPRQ